MAVTSPLNILASVAKNSLNLNPKPTGTSKHGKSQNVQSHHKTRHMIPSSKAISLSSCMKLFRSQQRTILLFMAAFQHVWMWSRVSLRVGWIKQIRGISERRLRTKGVSLIINLVYHGDMKADGDRSWPSIKSAFVLSREFCARRLRKIK